LTTPVQLTKRSLQFAKKSENPELSANKVLSDYGEWDGSNPLNLLELCDYFDFPYTFQETDVVPELSGTTRFDNNGNRDIIINTKNTDCTNNFSSITSQRRRQRFTLAHEIGHCVFATHCDTQLQTEFNNTDNLFSKDYIKETEKEANEFAAFLLVPTSFLKKFTKNIGKLSLQKQIESISNHYDVSTMVAIQRFVQVENYPIMAILFDKNGKCLRNPMRSREGADLNLYFDRTASIPSLSACKTLLGTGEAFLSKKHRDKSVWFPTSYKKLEVTEHAFKLGQYGYAVILEVSEEEDY
jgi:hypothetical protein